MREDPFVGRKTELKQLDELLNKKTAGLVVVKGNKTFASTKENGSFTCSDSCK